MGMRISEEFRSLIPRASAEELELLEVQLLREGCRDSLVVWKETGILLDGHQRFDICERHGLSYKTVELSFADAELAKDWVDANQLCRRNLTPDTAAFIRGRRYNRVKKPEHDGGKGGVRSGCQSGTHLPKTADKLAAQHGVSAHTIIRDGAFAAAVEARKAVDPDIERKVMAGEVKRSELIQRQRREEVVARLEDTAAKEAKALEGVFDVLVVDPPWAMEKIERDCRPNQVGFDYPTMSEDELSALPLPMADNCHVWLWTTHRFLPMALRLLEAWRLKYVCTFVWHKPGGVQVVGLPQFNCEFALYARRGAPVFVDTKALPVCFTAPRGEHSEKPGEFYDVVTRVTAGRRADIFARKPRAGWEVWGNEV